MRDPKRIGRILGKLSTLWRANPDLRLAQMLFNLTQRNDPFYVEDDVLEESLDVLLFARPTLLAEVAAHLSATTLKEGPVRKGGLNKTPKTPRPRAPRVRPTRK